MTYVLNQKLLIVKTEWYVSLEIDFFLKCCLTDIEREFNFVVCNI